MPTIRALRERFAEVAHAEAEKMIANLDPNDPDKLAQSVRRLSDLIANKLLHPAMVALKSNDENADLETLAAATRKLFDLELEPERQQAAEGESSASVKKREPA